jgi:hypothetical protein
MATGIRYVDPRILRVPPSRPSGADLFKLHQQIARYGATNVAMPPILAYECPDGSLLIVDGVTQATRIARLSPGTVSARGGHRPDSPPSHRGPED